MIRFYPCLLLLICVLRGYSQPSIHLDAFLPEKLGNFPGVRDFTMNAQGDEVYVTAQSVLADISVILVLRLKESGVWDGPEIAAFSGCYNDLEPFLAPDGLRLYFASNRPVDMQSDATKDHDIWYVERRDQQTAWSDPVNIGAPVNTTGNEFYPAITSSGNLYFTSDGDGTKGRDDIFFSLWENGAYLPPVSLSDSINTAGYEFNAWVAPDERMLLFTGYNRDDGYGSGDLYVSYLLEDGEWSHAEHLDRPVNSAQMDYCPFLDMESGRLYFTSRRSDLPAGPFSSAGELVYVLTGVANGSSRVYSVEMPGWRVQRSNRASEDE